MRDELRRERAALAIQTAVRGYLQRNGYNKMRSAAILLQQGWRRTRDSRNIAQEFTRLKGIYELKDFVSI